MGDSPQEPPISLYRRETDSGLRFGTCTTCELCGRTKRCFDEHGLVACRRCHRELLPGSDVLSSH